MREEILSIASDLREGSMSTSEAKEQLLVLFGVVWQSEQLICPHCGKYKRLQGNGIIHQLCECGE